MLKGLYINEKIKVIQGERLKAKVKSRQKTKVTRQKGRNESAERKYQRKEGAAGK